MNVVQQVQQVAIKDLKTVFGTLATMVTTCNVQHKDGEMIVRTMDAAHVALVDMKVNFPAISDGLHCLRIDDIWRTVKLFKSDAEFYYGQGQRYNGHSCSAIHFKTKTDKCEVNHAVEEPAELSTPLPKVPFTESATVDFKEFKNALRLINSQSDFITIGGGKFDDSKFSGKGEAGAIETTIKGIENFKAVATYSLEYLKPFVDRVQGFDKVKISYSEAKPLQVHFIKGNMRIDFYLAPRVEN